MGLGRIGFLGLTVVYVLGIGVARALYPMQPLGMLVGGCAVLTYIFWIVPSRLSNAGMHRHLNIVMLVPLANLLLLLALLIVPPKAIAVGVDNV